MKKFVLIPGIIIAFSSYVFAGNITPPEWSEFCPPQYLNSQPSKFNHINTYWYKRRMQFEAGLSKSSEYTGNDLKAYYDSIRQNESDKNLRWKAKQQAEQAEFDNINKRNQILDNFNTLNMLIERIR